MANQFRQPESCDHEIIDGATNKKIGDIRVKPSGILWSPSSSHSWYRASLERFRDWIEQTGTQQAK